MRLRRVRLTSGLGGAAGALCLGVLAGFVALSARGTDAQLRCPSPPPNADSALVVDRLKPGDTLIHTWQRYERQGPAADKVEGRSGFETWISETVTEFDEEGCIALVRTSTRGLDGELLSENVTLAGEDSPFGGLLEGWGIAQVRERDRTRMDLLLSEPGAVLVGEADGLLQVRTSVGETLHGETSLPNAADLEVTSATHHWFFDAESGEFVASELRAHVAGGTAIALTRQDLLRHEIAEDR